jgi:DNA topoisomerase-2
MIEVLRDEYERLDNKARFIQLVIDKKLVYINRKQEEVVKDMKSNDLKQLFNSKQKKVKAADEESSDEEEGEDTSNDSGESGYEYLFNLNVRAFTVKKVADLNKQRDNKLEQLETIQGTAPKTFWRKDIEKLLLEWDAVLEKDEEVASNAEPLKKSSKKKRSLKSKAPKAVKRQKPSSKDEGSSSSAAIVL